MNQIAIRVLGGLDIRFAGDRTALDLATRKSRAFLAYLALSPGMMRSREHLAAVLWDRSAEEQARGSLRQTLSCVRRALARGSTMICTDADSVWLDAAAVDLDALQFERLTNDGSIQSLESAIALYRGEFLSGFSLREERFEQWMVAERRRLHERAVRAFSELVSRYTRDGRHNRGIAAAERLLALDPLLEWAHCALIRLYLSAGRREAALRQYQECVRLLKQELGIAPAEETQALAAEIGRTRVARSDASTFAPDGGIAPGAITHPAEATSVTERRAAAPPVLPTERKQLTVLCARIRGAVDDADPETVLEQIDPVLRAMVAAAQRFGGTVSHVRSDSVTALFGAPIAQEDHAQRGCYAALAMRDAVAALPGAPLDLRIGVHSGLAVVRTIGDAHTRHYDAIGPVARLAADIDTVLAAGEIGISEETARRTEGFVELRGPLRRTLPGTAAPVTFYTLAARVPLRRTWEARSARELARFVGRDAELTRLHELLRRALGGAGQVITIAGEPGVGKSRLVHEFVHGPLARGCMVLETGTTSHETSATYLAIAHLLRARFAIEERDTQARALEKLRAGVEALDPALASIATPLAALLDLPVADARWPTLAPLQKRQRTLDAVKALVMRQCQTAPLILVVEDLHWSDPGTQAVLDHLVDSLAACRALLLLTHRPEYRHSWFAKSYFTQLRLTPLGSEHADRLLRALLGDDPALGDLRRQLIERTGGTPLFLEESVRALVDSGALVGSPGAYRAARPIGTMEIPSTVHAVLAARIDRLPPAQKSVLQTAAVIGQDVSLELLQPITNLDPDMLQAQLEELQAAEFLFQSRLLPAPQYAFKHALTHRVAYESLLRERRRAVHVQLLDIIETRYANRLDEHVERLAHHALAAEDRVRAIRYLYRSAIRAIQRSAHAQAIHYLRQGLELIGALPDGRERLTQELEYQKAIGVAMMAAKGWAAQEVLDAYTRAQILCEELRDERELFIALRGEGQYRMIGGEPEIARRLGQRCLALARRSKDVGVHIESHHVFWTNSFFMGRYAEAAEHAARGMALYRRERDHPLTYIYSGHDPGVCCRCFAALSCCLSGGLDRALELGREAVALGRALDHPLTAAIAYWACGLVHIMRGEPERTAEWAQRVLAVSDEYLLPVTRAQGLLHSGWSLAVLGQVREGLERMREGIAQIAATGGQMDVLYFRALLGEALGKAGQPDAGLAEVERALATARTRDALFQVPEMLRAKGDLLAMIARSHRADAEACYREAIAVAEAQDARLPKLTAATSLANLLARSRGGAARARAVLQPAYDAITEGRHTPVMRAAGTLLAELRG